MSVHILDLDPAFIVFHAMLYWRRAGLPFGNHRLMGEFPSSTIIGTICAPYTFVSTDGFVQQGAIFMAIGGQIEQNGVTGALFQWRKDSLKLSLNGMPLPARDADAVMDRAEARLESLREKLEASVSGLTHERG